MTSRALAAAMLGGTVAGLVSGVIARIEMRAVVLLRGEHAELGPATIGILVIFVILSIFLATLYLWRARRREHGMSVWILLGAILIAAVILATPLRAEFRSVPELALFIPTFLTLGALPVWCARLMHGRLRRSTSAPATMTYRALAALAILASISAPLFLIFGLLQTAGVIGVPAE